jgi:hypothetical protein
VRSVGRRDSRGGDKVQVFGVSSGAIGPIHGTRQRDGAVDPHRLGVRDPRLIIDPDRHACRWKLEQVCQNERYAAFVHSQSIIETTRC